jgi:hypothetical protein
MDTVSCNGAGSKFRQRRPELTATVPYVGGEVPPSELARWSFRYSRSGREWQGVRGIVRSVCLKVLAAAARIDGDSAVRWWRGSALRASAMVM